MRDCNSETQFELPDKAEDGIGRKIVLAYEFAAVRVSSGPTARLLFAMYDRVSELLVDNATSDASSDNLERCIFRYNLNHAGEPMAKAASVSILRRDWSLNCGAYISQQQFYNATCLNKERHVPSYEYECQDCGKSFTVEQSMKEHGEKRTPKCPECKRSGSVQRQLSPAYVQTSKKS